MKEHILLSSPCRLLILNKQFYEMSGIAGKKVGAKAFESKSDIERGRAA